ncbi:copper-binding protein [Acidovorax sp. GBBC 3334]|uniref:copper-binding protein n=1 Tax=Acidovorax sp. GBBC 3334 TaxID=2940496 RepID=UPI0023049A7D|nr:copper-binding protein [Acidovorax sp. GBBC 3334]MDA8456390.1 copper-binding protein [Acidovorax sp. GBBC 3334]
MSTARRPDGLRAALRVLAMAALLSAGLAQGQQPGAAAASASASASAAHEHTSPTDHAAQAAAAAPSPANAPPLSEGEVVRWDPATRRVTLRHGELKNLDMPPMTMVFRVQGEAPAGTELAPGTRVRFVAERDPGGFFTASRIEPVAR